VCRSIHLYPSFKRSTARQEDEVLILTGPTAAGKNTVGTLLAKQRERCAVVDFDAVRAMFVQPHRAPWQGVEGHAQHLLGTHLVCLLAERFAHAGWEVIILDVLSAETGRLCRQLLAPFHPTIVQLLPAWPELHRRFYQRGPVLTDEELAHVYAEQCALTQYDVRIDNTDLPPASVVQRLLDLV
jgi:hypothetical protein